MVRSPLRALFPGRDPKLDLLSHLTLFEGLSAGRLTEIAGVFDVAEIPAGDHLIEQGRLGQEFFIVVNGVASVEVDGHVVGAVGPGEIVGELAVLDVTRRTATVTALTDMRLLVAERRALAPLLGRIPLLAGRVAAVREARMQALGSTA